LAIAIPFIYFDEAFSLRVRTGWMLELHLLYLANAIVVALQGAGQYSIGGTNGRWN
jgi:putative oxidoreductase